MAMTLVAVLSAFSLAGLVLPASSADAAAPNIDQCNGFNGSPTGATTRLDCDVTVVNTINGATRGSQTTVTRQCENGICPGGFEDGTFVTNSTSLVTSVTQCNGSANDAAPPTVTCRVTITNNVSSDTPGAGSVTAATVNQCVGTGGNGDYDGRGPLVCNPTQATTGATVTQCNGSVTGGGSTAD